MGAGNHRTSFVVDGLEKPSYCKKRQQHGDLNVKITLVPSSVSDNGLGQHQFLTSYRINGTLAIDAGALGLAGTVEEQERVRHILITHSHMDHIASLPIFVENAYDGNQDCVTIHGSEAVLSCLRRDIFNDRVWPDFLRLSTGEASFLKLAVLESEKAIELERLRITPIPVDHVVPTFGFLVEEKDSAVVIVSDTGPTEAIWEYANRAPNLKAVFLEATFPDAMASLAAVSQHLTPILFAREIQKLKQPVRVLAVHIKARFQTQVIRELEALGMADVEVATMGKVYTF
jgi:ribonuclease BN (tRNA processing enzyme)